MKIFEGKSPTERNKIIAAIVLGALALFAIGYNVIGFYPSRKTTVTVSTTPTPGTTVSPNRGDTQISSLPTAEETDFVYTTTPVVYNPGMFYAPDAGRNIFAFYEPPPPTPYSPTPYVPPTMPPVKTPTPAPPPPLMVSYIMPQSVYTGAKTFRLEVNGDKFTPDSLIYFNGAQLPTTFISPQKLTAEVPSNFIGGAGQIIVEVRTPNGALYSNQAFLNVQAPPTPQFLYIGAKLSQRNNNNTAYFREQGRPEFGARLNDVVGGRFRLTSISSSEVVFEDVSLGFKHRLALYRPKPGEITQNPPYTNYNTVQPNENPNVMPGIPNIQIYNPTLPNNNPTMPPNTTRPANPNRTPVPNLAPTIPPKNIDDDDDPDDGN
jgi:hypothetical protein